MSRPDARLNLIARRQLETLGHASGLRYLADRMSVLDAAKSWLEENGAEDPDIMDIMAVAEFLAGDRVESG